MVVPPGDDLDTVELHRVRIPLIEPFVTAHGVEHERDVVLVRVVSGGDDGWGECSTLSAPTYSAEFTDDAWRALRDDIAPALLAGAARSWPSRPMATAAVDTACTDLSLRRAGVSLAAQLGGARSSIESCAVVGRRDTIESLLDAVADRVAAGHNHVKLKVQPGWDIEPLSAVRERWPTIGLAADANASYAAAPDVPAGLDALGLTYLEQPLAADQLAESAALAARLDTPLALDESITSMTTLVAALDVGAASVVNVKVARMGGIGAAVEAVRAVADRGRSCFVGGMLETGVGRAVALGVAALDPVDLPCDLGPSSRYFAEDLTEPFELVDGCLAVPTDAGASRRPREAALDRFTVDRVVIG